MIKFSIITINYNSDKKLIKTIESVKQQTFKNFEYILIDNNSLDKSKEIIEDNRNFFDKLIREKDKGIVDAINKGIIYAKGEYIILLHAGDYFTQDALMRIFSKLNSSIDAYFGSITYYNIKNRNLYFLKSSYSNLERSKHCMSLCHTASAIKREVLIKLELYNKNFEIAFDYEFVKKLIKNKCNILTDKYIVTYMLIGGISSKKFLKANYEEFLINNEYNKNKLYNIYFYISKSLISITYKVLKFLINKI